MCSKKSFSLLEVLKTHTHCHTWVSTGDSDADTGKWLAHRIQGAGGRIACRTKEEGGRIKRRKQNQGYVSITPSYSRVSEKLRRISSGSLQCSLFCGGQRCKYENAGRWGEKDRALRGLFSHWVTDNILAMARPSTHIFEEFQLVEQFKT